ncbi:Vps5 C terminal like-domain-containing protein [Umbelopsis sp. PMI_123]|nr:Vps5 C terminal like-domain-containing protein [Umbelopsis sp. PMI_123]
MSGYDDLLGSSNAGFQDSLEDNPFADATSHNTNVAQSMIEPRQTSTESSTEPAADYGQMSKSLNNLSIDKSPTTQYTPQDSPYEQYREETEPTTSEFEQTDIVPESGSRPYFEVSVEEPQKVGDAINAHTVYKVRTKTNSSAFRSNEMVVSRRYRDFLWLYNQLTTGNPGVIVPPVPEKHALGRFQDEFVESRRIALERCLRKIVAHPMLYGDPDLKVFLESESFNIDKNQKRAEPDTPKVGFMRSFGETLSNAATSPFTKFVEIDEWFDTRRNQLDILDGQLKSLLKSVEAVVKQRKDLGTASFDYGDSMIALASAELNRPLSVHLTVLGELQQKMKDLHEKQAKNDVLTLEHTIDEYIRLIGSIKVAFNSRAKAYQVYQNAASDLSKKKAAYEKLKVQPKTRHDKLTQSEQEIATGEQKMESYRKEFEEISKLIKSELDRFDKEKVEDFKIGVESFLESIIENQKQIIALWESYFEQTADSDEPEPEQEMA